MSILLILSVLSSLKNAQFEISWIIHGFPYIIYTTLAESLCFHHGTFYYVNCLPKTFCFQQCRNFPLVQRNVKYCLETLVQIHFLSKFPSPKIFYKCFIFYGNPDQNDFSHLHGFYFCLFYFLINILN